MGMNINKLKVNLNLAINRLKLISKKKEAVVAKDKQLLSELLRNRKTDSARIRAEGLIREINNIEAYEVVEIFCQLILTRIMLVETYKKCPKELAEGVHTLAYASYRIDVPELKMVRDLFAQKYGKDFVNEGQHDFTKVHSKVIEKMSIEPPPGFIVDDLLTEIAAQYNVDWCPEEPSSILMGGGRAVPSPVSVQALLPQQHPQQQQQQQQPQQQQQQPLSPAPLQQFPQPSLPSDSGSVPPQENYAVEPSAPMPDYAQQQQYMGKAGEMPPMNPPAYSEQDPYANNNNASSTSSRIEETPDLVLPSPPTHTSQPPQNTAPPPPNSGDISLEDLQARFEALKKK